MLTPLLVLWGVLDLVVAAAMFALPAQVDENAELTANDLVVGAAFLLYVMVVVTTIVTFGRLLVRSNVNARSFRGVVGFTPASMVWWHFVPIACLYKPYEAFKTVWQASGGERDYSDKHPRMPLWWATWLAANLLGNIGWRIPDSVAGVYSLVTAPVTIASCYFAIVVTRALTERQEATALEPRAALPSPSLAPA